MTSMQRQIAQKLTMRWVATRGTYYYTYAQMKSIFDGYSATYLGKSLVEFSNETALANAVADLDNSANYTVSDYGPTILTDIGKDVRLGVTGGDVMYTYRLMRVVNDPSGENDAGLVVYVMVDQNPSVNVINMVRNAYQPSDEYGQVWVSRGY